MSLPIKIDLPEHFLEGETRDGYYVSPEMKKLWAVEIDILFQIMAICERHDIRWFVEGGTLLGAVRHKGFIPWDDDIDIDMFREDYEKFIKYAKTELEYPYFLQTYETEPKSMYGHAKIRNAQTSAFLKFEFENQLDFNQGVFVDIFPLDKVPDSYDEAEAFAKQTFSQFCLARRKRVECLLGAHIPFRKNLYRLGLQYLSFFKDVLAFKKEGWSFIEKEYARFEEMCIKYNDSGFKHYTVLALPFTRHYFWPEEMYEGEMVSLPFEWFEVKSIKNYTDYLDCTFGNWREFVRGGSVHGDLVFDTEKPYTSYLKKWQKTK